MQADISFFLAIENIIDLEKQQIHLIFDIRYYIRKEMQPPQNPVDIKIVLGEEEGQHNLANFDFKLGLGETQVGKMKSNLDLKDNFEKDLVLVFDFYVENGREKDAIEYFNQGHQEPQKQTLSPLQRLFTGRPSPQSERGRFEIQQHTGFVRLLYRFYFQQDFEEINQSIQQLTNTGFNPSAHVNIDLKGFISHNKKNRTNVKVNYSKFEASSNTFSTSQMIESFTNMGMFEYEPEIITNPMFDLLKKSKTAKINLKFASFRKLSKYYEEVSSEDANKKHEVKGFSYTNKGIFRQKAEINGAFGSKYTANATIRYESEDVFTRLLKVYMTMIHKQFDINLAESWW